MLDEKAINDLITAAQQARKYAYAPYSHFQVGAAILGKTGKIYTGCNVENASYGLCNCAERTAIFKAVSEGEQSFLALVVTADTVHPVAPCGACRQVLSEFQIKQIIMCNISGEYHIASLHELLPFAFEKSDVTGEKS